jgi:hypothetical protein
MLNINQTSKGNLGGVKPLDTNALLYMVQLNSFLECHLHVLPLAKRLNMLPFSRENRRETPLRTEYLMAKTAIRCNVRLEDDKRLGLVELDSLAHLSLAILEIHSSPIACSIIAYKDANTL